MCERERERERDRQRQRQTKKEGDKDRQAETKSEGGRSDGREKRRERSEREGKWEKRGASPPHLTAARPTMRAVASASAVHPLPPRPSRHVPLVTHSRVYWRTVKAGHSHSSYPSSRPSRLWSRPFRCVALVTSLPSRPSRQVPPVTSLSLSLPDSSFGQTPLPIPPIAAVAVTSLSRCYHLPLAAVASPSRWCHVPLTVFSTLHRCARLCG